MVKSFASFALLLAAGCCASCARSQDGADTAGKSLVAEQSVAAEEPFVAGGSINLQLDGGDYQLRAAADNHIRITSGNAGNAKVEVNTNGTRANLKVTDTPHNNFRATIEVPQAADLVIRLSGGNLVMAAITGNKDIESNAGNMEIAVGDPNDYSSVDASVKAGDIDANAFGGSKSGLFPHFTWSGHGKYALRASLGAGNLVLRSK
jgi:hypothetical protein